MLNCRLTYLNSFSVIQNHKWHRPNPEFKERWISELTSEILNLTEEV